MRPLPLRSAAFLVLLTTVIGCSLVKPMVLKGVANTLSGEGGAVTSHDDPELVKGALDFALVTNESLLAAATLNPATPVGADLPVPVETTARAGW